MIPLCGRALGCRGFCKGEETDESQRLYDKARDQRRHAGAGQRGGPADEPV